MKTMKKSIIALIIGLTLGTITTSAFSADMGGTGSTPRTTQTAADAVEIGSTYVIDVNIVTKNTGDIDGNAFVGGSNVDDYTMTLPDTLRELTNAVSVFGAGGSTSLEVPKNPTTNAALNTPALGYIEKGHSNEGGVTGSLVLQTMTFAGAGNKDMNIINAVSVAGVNDSTSITTPLINQ